MIGSRSLAAAALAGLVLAGCVDSPSSLAATAEDGDPLALTFEALAQEAASSGDVSRAEGFTYAAIAARNGITPSRLQVQNGGASEVYEAFVHAIDWQLAATATLRVPAHRTITAWRRTSDGVTRILSVTTPRDSAPVLNPLSLSATGPVSAPFAGAGALYQETTKFGSLGTNATNAPVAESYWIAVAGFVRIRETLAGAACPRPPEAFAMSGVTCQQARFAVHFDASLQQLSQRPYTVRASTPARRIQTPGEQAVNGYKLTFACTTVSATRGCG